MRAVLKEVDVCFILCYSLFPLPTVIQLTVRNLLEAESITDGAARPWTFAFPNEVK